MMEPTIKDVMTTTVVAVKQGASYKEMAALLRKYRVSAFPDAGGYLVGIVSRADLLSVFDRPDQEIRAEIVDDVIRHEFLVDPTLFTVTVADGVVTVTGTS